MKLLFWFYLYRFPKNVFNSLSYFIQECYRKFLIPYILPDWKVYGGQNRNGPFYGISTKLSCECILTDTTTTTLRGCNKRSILWWWPSSGLCSPDTLFSGRRRLKRAGGTTRIGAFLVFTTNTSDYSELPSMYVVDPALQECYQSKG